MKALIAALVAALVAVVNVTPNRVSYACGGSVFSVPFPYVDWNDLKITSTTAAGAVTTLTPTTDFSINRTSSQTTGTVTLTAGGSAKCPNNTYILKITRTVDFTQPTPFRAQTTYNQSLHEISADRTEMQIQQLNTRMNDITSGDGGVSVQVQDEGVSQGSASILNCVGASLACTVAGSTATVNSSAPSVSLPNTWTDTQTFQPASGNKNAIVAYGAGTGAAGVFYGGVNADTITVTAPQGGYGGHFYDNPVTGDLAVRVDGEAYIQATNGIGLTIYGIGNQIGLQVNPGANGAGIFGTSNGSKDGVTGTANATGGGAKGIGGDATAGTGLTQYGVRGIGGTASGAGIPGPGGYFSGGTGGTGNSNGVRGEGQGSGAGGAFTNSGTGAAVTGTGAQGGTFFGSIAEGIYAESNSSTNWSAGHLENSAVWGKGLGTAGANVAGVSGTSSGSAPALYGSSATGPAVYADVNDSVTPTRGSLHFGTSTNPPSSSINGDVWVDGALWATLKSKNNGVTYTIAPLKAGTCILGTSCANIALPVAMICTCSDTTAANACKVAGTGPVTFTGTGTDTLNYTCLVAQ